MAVDIKRNNNYTLLHGNSDATQTDGNRGHRHCWLVDFDEEGTLAAQRSYRTEIIKPLLAQHNGRTANTAGDSFLFEFPSAVEAGC